MTKEPQESDRTDPASGSWSVSSENLFDILLFEFQRAYAEFGRELFFLGAFTYDELIAEPQIYEVAGCLGCVPLDDSGGGGGEWLVCENGLQRVDGGLGGGGGRCYYILAKNQGRLAQPYSVFSNLAARAGAFLPITAKQKIPFLPVGPVSTWLAYMWSCRPPTDEDLAAPDGVTCHQRVIWGEPFLEAAEIIERHLVCPSSTVQDQAGAGRSSTLSVSLQADEPKSETIAEVENGLDNDDSAELSPAWERLRLQIHTGGDDIAGLDGASYRLRGSAKSFLEILQNAKGGMVKATTIQNGIGERPSTIWNKLPPPLQKIIEKPGRGYTGYRML